MQLLRVLGRKPIGMVWATVRLGSGSSQRQVWRKSQLSYRFFHVCECLAEASKIIAKEAPEAWMETQKSLLKNNDFAVVIANLNPYIEADEINNDKAPVRACHRYLSNRTGQLDYKGAIEKGLPIGSGEIESAHRYVIQKRLKLSGAWWKVTHVKPMLALRVVRANDDWCKYWAHQNTAMAA